MPSLIISTLFSLHTRNRWFHDMPRKELIFSLLYYICWPINLCLSDNNMSAKLQILSGNLYLGQAITSVNEKSFWEMASDPFSPPALLSVKHQRAIQYLIIVFWQLSSTNAINFYSTAPYFEYWFCLCGWNCHRIKTCAVPAHNLTLLEIALKQEVIILLLMQT